MDPSQLRTWWHLCVFIGHEHRYSRRDVRLLLLGQLWAKDAKIPVVEEVPYTDPDCTVLYQPGNLPIHYPEPNPVRLAHPIDLVGGWSKYILYDTVSQFLHFGL